MPQWVMAGALLLGMFLFFITLSHNRFAKNTRILIYILVKSVSNWIKKISGQDRQ